MAKVYTNYISNLSQNNMEPIERDMPEVDAEEREKKTIHSIMKDIEEETEHLRSLVNEEEKFLKHLWDEKHTL